MIRFERKAGMAAEALDCMVYAFAAHAGAPIPPGRESELKGVAAAPAKPAVIRSAWLNRD